MLLGAAEVAGEDHRRRGRAEGQKDLLGTLEALAPAGRDRVVEGEDEIALGGGLQASLDDGPGRHEVGQRDRAEIVAQRGAQARGRGLKRRDPGADADRHTAPRRPVLAVEKLEDQRRHGVDAWIAGADEGDAVSGGREVQRLAAAILLRPQREAMLRGAGQQVRGEVEIEAVADDLLRLAQDSLGLARAPFGGTRADPDHRERPLRLPYRRGIDVARGEGHGAGHALTPPLGHEEGPARPGGGQRGALGHAPAAGLTKDDLGAGSQPIGLLEEPVRAQKPRRDVECGGQSVDGGLVGLEVDRGDAGDGFFGQARLGERGADEIHQRFRRRPALRADTDGKDRRMQHETAGIRCDGPMRDEDLESSRRIDR